MTTLTAARRIEELKAQVKRLEEKVARVEALATGVDEDTDPYIPASRIRAALDPEAGR